MRYRAQIANLYQLSKVYLTHRRSFYIIWRVMREKLTYLGSMALIDLHNRVIQMEQENRPGIFIEAGCALGGSALVITAAKENARPFYVYDAFSTIPPPSEKDGSDAHDRYGEIAAGQATGIKGDTYYGYQENLLERVKASFENYGLAVEPHHVALVEGFYENTLRVENPVALAHIDCDWYESVMICLERIVPHLVTGGILIIDDYEAWSGCRKAVDAYFADKQDSFEFVLKSRLHIVRK
jgi:hypothetical protein